MEQRGRKEWDDGRNEELWGVHMHSSLLQLRGVITKMYSHTGTHRERLIYKITMHETRTYIRFHQEASLTELPEFYWGVMKREGGV